MKAAQWYDDWTQDRDGNTQAFNNTGEIYGDEPKLMSGRYEVDVDGRINDVTLIINEDYDYLNGQYIDITEILGEGLTLDEYEAFIERMAAVAGNDYEAWKPHIVAAWTDEQLGTTDPEWIEHATVEIFNRAVDEAA